MSSKDKNLSEVELPSLNQPDQLHIGIVVSEWNDDITLPLKDGCYATLLKAGILEDNIHVVTVPGAYELPLGARLLAGKEKLDAVVCIGCVIKGETKHDEYINNAVAQGIMNLGLSSGKPVIYGVLTPNSKEQAIARAGGKHGNKGVEAAATALRMIGLSQELSQQKQSIGY